MPLRTRTSTDTATGWYPGAHQRIGIPDSNFAPGNDGPLAAALHIIVGSLASAISEFQARKLKSAHFGIGKDGRVVQFVSIHDTAFANGLSWNLTRTCWVDPEKNLLLPPHTPPWPLLHAPRNPNYYTISIEREGHPEDTPTAAMDAATVALLRWLAEQFPATLKPYRPLVNLIGHCHIGPIHRAHCPGPHVDYVALATAANGDETMPDWNALWGSIATPDATSWQWSIPILWKQHHERLGKCLYAALYDDRVPGLVLQLFEGGDIRGLPQNGTVKYEVCLK